MLPTHTTRPLPAPGAPTIGEQPPWSFQDRQTVQGRHIVQGRQSVQTKAGEEGGMSAYISQ